MTKPRPMSEDELRALTDAEMRQAIGYFGGKLAEQRRKAEVYYQALPELDLSPPEIEGRSNVVSPDIRNTVEAMLPQLMVKFTGGDSVVEFEPTQPNDEDAAKQVTDYLNYLFYKKNNGHRVTYTMFKDALLQKIGVVKVWWDERTEQTKEYYHGLTNVELAEILDDDEIEVTEQNSYPSEEDQEQRQQALQQLEQQLQQAAQMPPPQVPPGQPAPPNPAQQIQAQIEHIKSLPPVILYDLTAVRSKKAGKVTIENVPPEEFLINRNAKSIKDASFVGHRVMRTVSDLRSMGYKNVDNIQSDDSAASFNMERVTRLSFDDEQAYANFDSVQHDESQRQIWVTECYVRCDYDGDGISELRKVVRAGNQILENDVVDVTPFASVCPVPLPHKFFGMSIFDLGWQAQYIKTDILRAKIDNTRLQTNGRYFAVEGQVNLDDLLMSRPGGIVRVTRPDAVGRLEQGSMDGSADNMLEYMEDFLESSTGWTRQSQGTNAQDLRSTATGMNIVTNKDDMRLDLIARHFAEGFTEVFQLMLKLVCQHQHETAEIKLNGQWLKIDPREWRNQFDININVGLGVGNKDQRIGHLNMMAERQKEAFSIGVATPENVYNANCELAKEMGYRNGDKFFTDPVKHPPPQKPPPEVIKAQAEAQAQMPLIQAKAQADAQLKQMSLQAEGQHKVIDAQLADQQHQRELAAKMQAEQFAQQMQAAQVQHQNELEAQRELLRQQQEAQQAAFQAELDQQAKNAQMAFDKWKAELEAATKIEIAQISAKTSLTTASMSAQTAADATVAKTLGEGEKQEPVMSAIKEVAAAVAQHGKKIDEHGKKVAAIQEAVNKPRPKRKIEYDAQGKLSAVDGEPVKRNASGKIEEI